MERYKQSDGEIKSIYDVLEYVIVAALFFNGNMVWKYLPNGLIVGKGFDSNLAGYIACWTMFVYVIMKALRQRKIVISKRKLLVFAFVLAHATSFIVFNSYNYMAFIFYYLLSIAVMVPFCWLFDMRNRWREFFTKYAKIVFWFSLLSLIMYLFGVIIPIIPGKSVLIVRNGLLYEYKSYLNLLYTYQTQDILGRTMIRNCSLFLEGPGYAFPLAMALFAEYFCREKRSRFRVFILLVSIVTSFSYKGFIVAPLIFGAKLFAKPSGREKFQRAMYRIRKLLIPIVFVLGFVLLRILLNVKMLNDANSYLARMEDTYVALMIWTRNFLFGIGFNNHAPFQTMLLQRYAAVTCGAIKLLAQCGVYLGLQFYGGLYAFCKFGKAYDKYALKVWIGLLLFFLFTSSTCYEHIFLVFISFGLSNLYYIGKGDE